MIKKLEAAKHWCLRRMLRMPWTDKVSTCEVFRRAGVGKGIMQDIIGRQMMFLGHVIRKYELGKVVLTGYVEGTRKPKRNNLDVSQQTQWYKTSRDNVPSHRQRYVDTVV